MRGSGKLDGYTATYHKYNISQRVICYQPPFGGNRYIPAKKNAAPTGAWLWDRSVEIAIAFRSFSFGRVGFRPITVARHLASSAQHRTAYTHSSACRFRSGKRRINGSSNSVHCHTRG